jgi:hypothetical protein
MVSPLTRYQPSLELRADSSGITPDLTSISRYQLGLLFLVNPSHWRRWRLAPGPNAGKLFIIYSNSALFGNSSSRTYALEYTLNQRYRFAPWKVYLLLKLDTVHFAVVSLSPTDHPRHIPLVATVRRWITGADTSPPNISATVARHSDPINTLDRTYHLQISRPRSRRMVG